MFLAPCIDVGDLVIRGVLISFIEGAIGQNALIFLLNAPCCIMGAGDPLPTGRSQGNKVRVLGVVPLEDFLNMPMV